MDSGKFTRRFWSDVTPFEVGAAATVRAFQTQPDPVALRTGLREA